MKYIIPLLLLSVFLIPLVQSVHAQQNTSQNVLNKIGPLIHNFTSGATQALSNTGEKIESIIHNSTSESNQTGNNTNQGTNNVTAQVGQSINKTATQAY